MNRGHHFIRQHLRTNAWSFMAIILAGVLNNFVSFLLPVSIGEFFTLFFHTGSSKDRLLKWLGVEVTTLHAFFIMFCGLLLLKAILTLVESYGTFRQGEIFVKKIREDIFEAQINWSAVSFLEKSYGKYLLRYSNDLKAVQNYLSRGYMDGIKSSLFLLTGLFLLMQINMQLTVLVMILLVTISLSIYAFAQWQTSYIVTSRSSRSSLLAFVARHFARFKKIKDRSEEKRIIDQFKIRSDKLFRTNMRYNVVESLLLAMVPVFMFGIILILLWRIMYLKDEVSASQGVMIVLILLMMEGGIRKLLKVPSYLNKGRISLQKINKLLGEPSLSQSKVIKIEEGQI